MFSVMLPGMAQPGPHLRLKGDSVYKAAESARDGGESPVATARLGSLGSPGQSIIRESATRRVPFSQIATRIHKRKCPGSLEGLVLLSSERSGVDNMSWSESCLEVGPKALL